MSTELICVLVREYIYGDNDDLCVRSMSTELMHVSVRKCMSLSCDAYVCVCERASRLTC